MKKLERMDGKLFESLKQNDMSQMSHLLGGLQYMATLNGQDAYYIYETFSATLGDSGVNQDNPRDDGHSATRMLWSPVALPNTSDLQAYTIVTEEQ